MIKLENMLEQRQLTDNIIVVTTPFLNHIRDYIEVYIDGDRVTDCGDTVQELFMIGIEDYSDVEKFAELCGVQYREHMLFIETTDYQAAVEKLALVILAILNGYKYGNLL